MSLMQASGFLREAVGPVELVPLMRILLAALLGGAVGWERERHGRPAGLRTHLVLCAGCALVMLLSLYLPGKFSAMQAAETTVRSDPARLAASVLTGLGFLGAGAIIVLGQHVRGLTTATCIWVTAAIGLAVGAGYVLPAVFCHLLVLFALLTVDRWEKRMESKDRYVRLRVTFPRPGRRAAEITESLESHGLAILQLTTDRHGEKSVYNVHLRYSAAPDFEAATEDLAQGLADPPPSAVEWT